MRINLSERGRSARVREWGFLEQLEARALLGGDPFPDIGLMEDQSNPILRLDTQYGAIDIEVLANRDATFAEAYLRAFNSPERHQTVFHNLVAGVALEAGRLSYLADNVDDDFAPEFGGDWTAPVSPQAENLARTVTALARRMPGPPFSLFYNTSFYFNLQDNAPPADEGEYAVVARVLGDAAWDVVQTIAGLMTTDFGNGAPFPNRGYATPITGAWSPGDPIPPELLVQITDVSVIKAQDAEDFFTHTIYSAEGFTGSNINEFVPISNPNDEAIHYEVWARYEAIPGAPLYARDQLIERGTIGANSRGGVTVSTTTTWMNAAVRHGVPYAIEVRSTLPVAANLSHYDFGSATGEGFTGETNEKWTFVGLSSASFSRSFLLWHNPTDEAVEVTITITGNEPGETLVRSFTVDAHRRGGMAVGSLDIDDFRFNATVEATGAIVAQLSSYDTVEQFAVGAWTTLGQAGAASTVGVMPLALEPNVDEVGRSRLRFKIYNPGDTTAFVGLELYSPGSTVPINFLPDPINVDGGTYVAIEFPTLEDQPSGPFTLVYRSDVPIYAAVEMMRTEDRYHTQMATSAGTEYHFAEGFTDPSRTERNVLEEYITVFNPNSAAFGTSEMDATVTFTFRYTDGTTFSINRNVAAGANEHVAISDLQEVIDQANLHDRFFYSIEVSSDVPIIAQMIHTDATLGEAGRATGGFATLGTIFGDRVRLDELPPP